MDTIEVKSNYEIERNKPMPSKLHGFIQSRLSGLFMKYYDEKYVSISELSLNLGGWKVVPDLCLYKKETIDLLEDEISMTQAPVLAIEIISATQSIQDLTEKIKKYLESGVQSCWLIIPILKNIYVFQQPQQYEIFKQEEKLADSISGIELSLTEIFI